MRVKVVVAEMEPDVPVMVTVVVPGVVELPAARIRVLDPVVGFGTKDAVTPLGRPDAESVTLPLNPY